MRAFNVYKIKLKIRALTRARLNSMIIILNSLFTRSVIHKPFQVVYVPLSLIKDKVYDHHILKYQNKFGFKQLRVVGSISHWSSKTMSFEETPKYKVMSQRFHECREWHETNLTEEYRNLNEESFDAKKYQTFSDYVENKAKKWDQLYLEMKTGVYKTPEELGEHPMNAIQVAITKDGDIVQVDGNHRLALAKILRFKEIPVIVNVFHKDYYREVKTKTNSKNRLTPKDVIAHIVSNNNVDNIDSSLLN